jgi:hypothetical protein
MSDEEIAAGELTRKRRFARIPRALDDFQLGRTKLYEIASENKSVFKKVAGLTYVDYDALEAVIAAAPSE